MKISPTAARRLRRGLIALAVVFGLAGAGMLAYPFATDLWAARIQSGLAGNLAASADDYREGKIRSGEPLTRLQIPKLDVDVVVVEGTSLAALRAGAGHYPSTALPGEEGNVSIAGHRTTYGRPFARMDELTSGDRVVLTTPIGRHVYEITGDPFVVSPLDWTPIRRYPKKGSFLTLTSCHPEGSAAYRIVVRGKLVKSSDVLASTGEAS
jgi:sortase A